MVVVAHKTIVMYGDTVVFGMGTEQLYKIVIILLIPKDSSMFYSSVDDVIAAKNLYAGFAWALALLFEWWCFEKYSIGGRLR